MGAENPAEVNRHLDKYNVLNNDPDHRRRRHLPLNRDIRRILNKVKRSSLLSSDDQDNLELLLKSRIENHPDEKFTIRVSNISDLC